MINPNPTTPAGEKHAPSCEKSIAQNGPWMNPLPPKCTCTPTPDHNPFDLGTPTTPSYKVTNANTATPDQKWGQKWRERWGWVWGDAPLGSLKYKKGEEIEDFISSLLAEARAEERVKALLEARACIAMSMAALIDNYKGKLPFVVFGGKADDKEKMTIYEQAIKDAHGWITQMMPITHLQASDKGK